MPVQPVSAAAPIARPPRRGRPGFTLAEMIIALLLLSVVVGGILSVLADQQRFYRGMNDVITTRDQARGASTLLPMDLRSISTSDTLANVGAGERLNADVYAWSDTSIEYRSIVGTSVVCVIPTARGNTLVLPPLDTLASGAILTSWITTPVAGDSILLYNDGMYLGSGDDRWNVHEVTGVTTVTGASACPLEAAGGFTRAGDATKPSIQITISRPAHTTALAGLDSTIIVGAPIRFFRPAGFTSITRGGRDYIGTYSCNRLSSPVCTDTAIVGGPLQASNGFRLVYLDSIGDTLDVSANDPRDIRRIDVNIRVMSDARVSGPGGTNDFYRQWDRVPVGIRNKQ